MNRWKGRLLARVKEGDNFFWLDMTSQRNVQLMAFISYSITDYKSLQKEANNTHYLNSNIHQSITISIPAKTRSITIDEREIINQDIGL